jgi:hypothetical protein
LIIILPCIVGECSKVKKELLLLVRANIMVGPRDSSI